MKNRFFPEILFTSFLLLLAASPVTSSGPPKPTGPPLSHSEALGEKDLLQPRPKIGVALSGGGAAGLAHIGVLRILEEHGIPVDMVSANSMGAVVGALYAIGYSPDEIEDAVTGTDWMKLFKEKPDRTTIPVYERPNAERYQAKFTIKGKKVDLLPGIKSGQSIYKFFSQLTWPAHLIDDFSGFPRPFICIATDIGTGEAVVLDRGFLPDAMRASMSIPGVFTPFRIDGRLLVDGLLSRDFPVEDLKDMGADIIIGVATGSQPVPVDSIDTMIDILTQSMVLSLLPARKQQASLCDILITPDLNAYTVIDFHKAYDIIRAGEEGAEKLSVRLDRLADSLSGWEYDPPGTEMLQESSIEINDIEIIGSEKISKETIRSSIGIDLPAVVTAASLDRIVDRLYGTGRFEHVSYRFRKTGDRISLLLHLREDKRDFLNIGLYYDTIWKHSLLLNLDLADPINRGSMLDVDIILGSRVKISSLLGFRSGFENIFRFGIGTDYLYDFIDLYDGSDLVSRFKMHNIRASAGAGLSLSRYISSSAKVVSEWSRISPDIAPAGFESRWDRLIFLDSEIYLDNIDRSWFPRKGVMLGIESQIAGSWLENGRSFNRLSGRLLFRIPLHRKIVLGGRFMLGSARGDLLPVQYHYFVGGACSPFTFHSPRETNLYGYRRHEFSGRHALVSGVDLQLQPMRYIYLIIHGNAGNAVEQWNTLFRKEDLAFGSALTLGLDTPLGPVEISAANSSKHNIIFFFSGGYRF